MSDMNTDPFIATKKKKDFEKCWWSPEAQRRAHLLLHTGLKLKKHQETDALLTVKAGISCKASSYPHLTDTAPKHNKQDTNQEEQNTSSTTLLHTTMLLKDTASRGEG